ncbi:MAG: divergent polysaccharide deacetylase family protein [Woeseiaceae bacterium]|nr:divergent polysaccharide deacetylase family protein [Woeseiaceae bacterium]
MSEPPPRIAIIIDDLGHALPAGLRALNLPGPVVCSVLPQTPRGKQIAEAAHARGKEVLMHQPLQAIDDGDRREQGFISIDMNERRLVETLAANLASVPHAIGVNGHRGSLLTRHPGHMRWLMRALDERGLVFVDSYTTHLSVALRLAKEQGIASTRRDVFLDADPHPEAIAREFERLVRLARNRGSAVAIGHPYPATLAFLEAELPRLGERGVELVGLGTLLRRDTLTSAPVAPGRRDAVRARVEPLPADSL